MLTFLRSNLKPFLPDWPEWALDVLFVMSDLLLVTGVFTLLFGSDQEAGMTTTPGPSSPRTTNGDASVVGATRKDYNGYTVRELKDMLRARDLTVSGLKADLVERLEEDDEAKPLAMSSRASQHQLNSFKAFRRKYLVCYTVIMLADWMQGTHMYTLYMSYGVNVSTLFTTGFLSGGIFAPFMGSFVDKFGRKRSCIVYCVLEIVINVMEGFDNFAVLILGRIMGGVSTNLLFTSFESWMTTEHRKQGFPEPWLASIYSKCSIINGSTAVLAGIVAQVLEDYLGQIGPFHGAVGLTALALFLVLGWEENYGDEDATTGEISGDFTAVKRQFIDGWTTTMSDSRVWRIGLTQALSEGAMYTFVFMWVPTLLSLDPPGGVPTGCVFSSLMMAITIGGLLFPPLHTFISTFVVAKEKASEVCASFVYALAGFSMAVPVMCLSGFGQQYSSSSCQHWVIGSFLVVEFCVGLFMPVAGTLRSKYVPDNLQGAILNIFRLPLNTVVVSGTYATEIFEPSLVFKMVSGCFFAAALLQASLAMSSQSIPPPASGKSKIE